MGFFSWCCPVCNKSVISVYAIDDPELSKYAEAVCVRNGLVLSGDYDGYGRIDHDDFDEEDNLADDKEVRLYHRFCWEGLTKEEQRAAKDGKSPPSLPARDQGYFFIAEEFLAGTHDSRRNHALFDTVGMGQKPEPVCCICGSQGNLREEMVCDTCYPGVKKHLCNLILKDSLESELEPTFTAWAYSSKPLKERSFEELLGDVADRYSDQWAQAEDACEEAEAREPESEFLRIMTDTQVQDYIGKYCPDHPSQK